MNWRGLFSKWQKDYDFKTFTSSFASMLITIAFALYNGYLRLAHRSHWHGSICVYYLLLVALRAVALLSEKEALKRECSGQEDGFRLRMYLICSILLLVLNLCLIGPVALLVMQEKPVDMTKIPAIAMAAYTFYKITIAAINLAKRRTSGNCLVRLLRAINFIDALLSIATLQNTLIMVATTGDKITLLPLTATTSALIWLAVVALSVSGLIWGIKAYRRDDK